MEICKGRYGDMKGERSKRVKHIYTQKRDRKLYHPRRAQASPRSYLKAIGRAEERVVKITE